MKIFIDGEYGTTGLQIRQRLTKHKDVEIISIDPEQRHNKTLRQKNLQQADFAILCLPDNAAKEAVQLLGDAPTRIIDASTAHRIDNNWTYGFIELTPTHHNKIKNAARVSNPGCYSTAAIAMIRPLIAANILPHDALISINAISGYSGGGKKMISEMESADHPPHFLYALNLQHKHLPEITKHSLLVNSPIFTPSVGNFKQGMAVQLPLHTTSLNANKQKIFEVLRDYYATSKNIKIMPPPHTRLLPTQLVGTDVMEIYVCGDEEKINLVALLDNLGKGASGACLQALEIMMG